MGSRQRFSVRGEFAFSDAVRMYRGPYAGSRRDSIDGGEEQATLLLPTGLQKHFAQYQ